MVVNEAIDVLQKTYSLRFKILFLDPLSLTHTYVEIKRDAIICYRSLSQPNKDYIVLENEQTRESVER